MELIIRETRGLKTSDRCVLSRRLAEQLGKTQGGHVRVESDQGKSYYIIDNIYENQSGLKVSEGGLDRINAQAGDHVTVKSTVPIQNRKKAFITGDITETFWDRDDAEIFISCPHGGDIEYNTDEMGTYLFKKLLAQGIGSSAWILHGYYTGQEKDAFKRWHVKKPVRAYDAYPGLQKLKEENRSFRYGIGFHIQKADHVGVGGMADHDIREMIADAIRRPVPSKYEIRTDYQEMKLTGKGTSMSMNHFAEEYQGIQIEMPRRVAHNKFHTLPEAVGEVLGELL
ncbi:poly-gamma-glutamate hydrolase family protein [Halosimplex pelagicum]|uniref:Poly-gamma-glutamate hydrolase family protein n=1 Tax=Halosimplex pelagicum TaxID=869886 RepID=A0A7D5TDB4_9EURY|nr:poly-gamma-glutamate hydrolase family protein [Halosimplex pelagicum]QLH83773.1 poly-gamma-glutamate hydrolase family protein [Halosimplex pelagicum]